MARPPARHAAPARHRSTAARPVRRRTAAPARSEAPPADRPLAAALLAAARAATEALARPEPAEAVHGMRRALKQARALLRLVGADSRPAARELRRELAQAARTLAIARDTHVLHDALADLAAHGDNPALPAVADLAAGHTAPTADASAALEALAAADLPARIATAAHALGDLAPEALPRALAAGYARARHAGRGIAPDDTLGLHELRKQVVAHQYQMALATPWWRKLGKLWRGELDRLRETLGKHHDLEILIARLDAAQNAGDGEHALTPEVAAATMAAAHARQRKLGRKALRRHARLFTERPRAFRRRLGAYRRGGK